MISLILFYTLSLNEIALLALMRAQWTMLSIWGILILATPLRWTCVPVSKCHSTLQCLLCFCLWDSYLFSVILLLFSFFSFQVFFTSRTPVLPRHALVSSVTESNCHSALHCQLFCFSLPGILKHKCISCEPHRFTFSSLTFSDELFGHGRHIQVDSALFLCFKSLLFGRNLHLWPWEIFCLFWDKMSQL